LERAYRQAYRVERLGLEGIKVYILDAVQYADSISYPLRIIVYDACHVLKQLVHAIIWRA